MVMLAPGPWLDLTCVFVPNLRSGSSSSYVRKELEALEKEQSQIDTQAAAVETKLRLIMEKGELSFFVCLKH